MNQHEGLPDFTDRPEMQAYPPGLPSAGPALDATSGERLEQVETSAEPDRTVTDSFRVDMPLAELTTMRVGGPAERLIAVHSSDELVAIAEELWADDEPWLLLGGGSNTIINDDGFPGTVVLVRYAGMHRVDDAEIPDGCVRVHVAAGQDWDQFVEWTVEEGLAGLEMLSGIPGLAGAAPVQNIGAYGGELARVLRSVDVFDRARGTAEREAAADLGLGYRTSAFKQGREAVILGCDVVLRESDLSEPVVFPQLAQALGVKIGARVPLREVRDTVLRVRAQKGMVLDANDHDTWSAGSFFTNPIVTASFARTLPRDAPQFPLSAAEPAPEVTLLSELEQGAELRVSVRPTDEPRVKLSAAWLIEHAGVPRGFRLPGSGAAISTKHTLALTNRGGASAADIAQLARYVIAMVQTEFGVVLEPEPNLYGLEL